MNTPTLATLEAAAESVYRHLQPTPQLHWPLLSQRSGCEVWVKHENYNPTGAFKVRGGLYYVEQLLEAQPEVKGLVTATRGNHGQSIAFAAQRFGLQPVIVVPEGNNPEKNAAMRALGAELIVHGKDFDEAIPRAQQLAEERGLHRLPSFHENLVAGVGTYALEFLRARPELQRVFVPIGLGSGICGVISARNALKHPAEVIAVTSSAADCYAQSLAAGRCISTDSAATLADGMAVRVPSEEALAMMLGNVSRVVTVDDDEILTAMQYYFSDTHNVAEGAGAAPLAALLKDTEGERGVEVGLILSGANADAATFTRALQLGA